MKAEAVNLSGKLSLFDKQWFPRVVVSFNGHDVMLVNVKGRFVWRSHTETDDFFLVLRGRLRIEMRDGTVSLGPGELHVAPRGIEQAVHLGLRALLQLPSRHRARQNSGGLQSGRAEVRTGRRTPPMTQAYRVEGGASLDRARPPLLRGSTASFTAVRGRHARICFARQRRASRRPLIQAPQPARDSFR
jgi:hypothetical protein